MENVGLSSHIDVQTLDISRNTFSSKTYGGCKTMSSAADSRSKKSAVAAKGGGLGVYPWSKGPRLSCCTISVGYLLSMQHTSSFGASLHRTVALQCIRCERYFILFSKIYCIMAVLY